MMLWKGNRLKEEWEMSNKDIVVAFKKSRYYKERDLVRMHLDQALVWFITSKDGLDSIYEWDEEKGSIDGSKDIQEMLKMLEK